MLMRVFISLLPHLNCRRQGQILDAELRVTRRPTERSHAQAQRIHRLSEGVGVGSVFKLE